MKKYSCNMFCNTTFVAVFGERFPIVKPENNAYMGGGRGTVPPSTI